MKRVKGVEDLNIRIIDTQGILRVGAYILISIAWSPVGGISNDGPRWVGCKKKSFFLPVKVLSARFRNLFLKYLREAFQSDKRKFLGEMAGLTQTSTFETMCRQARRAK